MGRVGRKERKRKDVHVPKAEDDQEGGGHRRSR